MGDEQMLVGSIHLMGVDGTLTDDGIDPAGLPELIKVDHILHGPVTAFTVALLHIDRAMILHDEYIRSALLPYKCFFVDHGHATQNRPGIAKGNAPQGRPGM